jgi:MFS family permease
MPVMIFGAVICFVTGFIYPITLSVSGFLLLRLFHGLSTGFKPTATAAYVADIVPVNRRGEAMGILGLFSSTGTAMGPVLGSYIAQNYSYEYMFYASSILAILSVAIIFWMKETLPEPQKFSLKLLNIKKEDFFEKSVLPAAITMLLSVYGYGVILTIISDYSELFQISNKGYYLSFVTVASILTRFFAGKTSDKKGRVIMIKYGLLVIAFSMLLTGFVQNDTQLYIMAFFYGIGIGMVSPTIFAWTIDLAPEEFRGRAMATLYISLEISIGLGALLSGYLLSYENGFLLGFLSVSILAIFGLLYLFRYERKAKLL